MLRLEVYVSGHCFGCPEARRLAGVVADRFKSMTVRVVDLDVEPDARPERVIAVPAYLLDGKLVSFGNPRQRDLINEIELALAAERVT
ncbi:MAG: thioredoxin family protein [Chloroflexi bacterium]|nr:thioredoxin family protein [Chloroflexota bacterium]